MILRGKGLRQRLIKANRLKHRKSKGEYCLPPKQKRGQLHRDLGVPMDQKIPINTLKVAANQSGVIGKRAQLALTFKGFKKPKRKKKGKLHNGGTT